MQLASDFLPFQRIQFLNPDVTYPAIWLTPSNVRCHIEYLGTRFMALKLDDGQVMHSLLATIQDAYPTQLNFHSVMPSLRIDAKILLHADVLHIQGVIGGVMVQWQLQPQSSSQNPDVEYRCWQGCWEGVAPVEVHLTRHQKQQYVQLFSLGEQRYQVEGLYVSGLLECDAVHDAQTQWHFSQAGADYQLTLFPDGHLEVWQTVQQQQFHAYLQPLQPVQAIPAEIDELMRLLDAIPDYDHQAIIENWYYELQQSGLPLTELDTTGQEARVLFLYKGQHGEQVDFVSDMRHWLAGAQSMSQIGQSGIFYFELKCPSDSRFDYCFRVNGHAKLDANNAHHVARHGLYHNSWLAMPRWPYKDHLKQLRQTPLAQTYTLTVYSEHLAQQRRLHLYLSQPKAAFQQSRQVNVIYAHDGDLVLNEGAYPCVLDRLQQLFPERRFALVMLATDNRLTDYALNQRYVDFVKQTCMPYVDAWLGLETESCQRYMTGISMGALISLYFNLCYPDTLSGLGLQSPAGPQACIQGLYAHWDEAKFSSIPVYLDYAAFDYMPWRAFALELAERLPTSMLSQHRWHDGHSFGNYQLHTLQMFKTLLVG